MTTTDGSHTIEIPEMKVTYHSHHGAIQESMHVFINAGLLPLFAAASENNFSILEMGFGTGLNALLTLIAAQAAGKKIHFTTLETHPLELTLVEGLNYCRALDRLDLAGPFIDMHTCSWNLPIAISPNFELEKKDISLTRFFSEPSFDLIYFDAFAPAAQPELWTVAVFTNLYRSLKEAGSLVTYCSKGEVRRAMQAAGFTVSKIPGPPGKREMVIARKFIQRSS